MTALGTRSSKAKTDIFDASVTHGAFALTRAIARIPHTGSSRYSTSYSCSRRATRTAVVTDQAALGSSRIRSRGKAAQCDEGLDFFIGRHYTVLVLQGLEAVFLDRFFREGHHLILIRYLALPTLVGVAIKEISGESNLVTEFSADDLANRFAQYLPLQIEHRELESSKAKHMTEQF